MPIANAGFDVDVQASRAALNRTIDGFLAMLLAQGTTQFSTGLPSINLGFGTLALGALSVDVESGTITALRAVGTSHHGVEADFDVTGTLQIASSTLSTTLFGATINVPLPAISATITISFQKVDLDVDMTAHGIPDALVLGLKHSNLAGLTPSNVHPAVLGPILQSVLSLLTTVLQAGVSLATTLVPSIPITVKPMIDAFSLFGLRLHRTGSAATSSPFVTSLGVAPNEALVLATDFERVNPPPVGDPSTLAPLLVNLPKPPNMAVALDDGVINQAVEIAMGMGIVPSVFSGGGFNFHVTNLSLALLGAQSAAAWQKRNGFTPRAFFNPAMPGSPPLGAVEIYAELRAKRGSCWCQVKVRIEIDTVIWPYVATTAQPPVPGPVAPGAPVARQSGVHLKMFFDAEASVNVSGYLIMLIDLIFGPILIPLLFVLSQVANVVISQLLPYSRTINPTSANAFTLTASSASVNAFITFALDFTVTAAVEGEGDLLLDNFTGFRLVDDATYNSLPVAQQNRVDIKVDYDAGAITVDDHALLLAATLQR